MPPMLDPNNPPDASQFSGVNKFLDLKKVFNDAVRQQQWKMQESAADAHRQRSLIAGQMAGSNSMTGSDWNNYTETGNVPDAMAASPSASMASGGMGGGQDSEDFYMTPKTTSYKGRVQTTMVPTRKTALSQKTVADIATLDDSASDLEKNLVTLRTKGLTIGPGFSTTPGAISDVLGQMKGPEFASFKADTGRAFQKYRKWATGVAAGYPELNMLAPNFPKATDTNDVFIKKSLSVINDIQRNREILLDHLSKSNYAVGQFRKTSSNSNTQKSGDNSDYDKYLQAIGQ